MNQENEKQVTIPENNQNQAPVTTENTKEQITNPTPVAEITEAPVEPSKPKIQDEVIYKIKEDKGGNLFGVILFFAIMFAALYYLPTISEIASEYIPGISKIKKNKPIGQNETPDQKEPTEEQDDGLMDLNGFVSNAGIDNLLLGNFVKDNKNGLNKLTFYILNDGNDVFIFNDNTKFYIDLYQDNTYLSSALVYSYKNISSKESIDFSVTLPIETYKRANKFKIVRKNKSDYPSITITNQEGEYKKLECRLNNNIIDYYFIDNFLEVINDTYTESITNPNYNQDLEKYRNEANKFSAIPSIDYNLIESTEGFNVKTRVDLKDINDSDLNKLAIYKYFAYHKEDKVVSFEMTSLGYDCS